MKVFTEISALRAYLKDTKFNAARSGQHLSVGLVPTMGFLHEGHASLMKRARMENDLVVLSIFVNPIQFGPNEDFETYPRDAEKDLALAIQEGVDVVFLPSVEEMYPRPTKTTISVKELTAKLCGASRPGHFDGVTTVVGKIVTHRFTQSCLFRTEGCSTSCSYFPNGWGSQYGCSNYTLSHRAGA